MKLGRNEPCLCGSGKKYKKCCINSDALPHSDLGNELAEVLAINPNLTLDELEAVAEHKTAQHNNRPDDDFCGLSPEQMANWLYAPLDQLNHVTITTPDNLSSSPVMAYLNLIIEEAIKNDGSFKATAKGNLPAKLVKQASALLPSFAIAVYETELSISEFSGSNEDKFNTLHYSRVLAEIFGIIYLKDGKFHLKKAAQKQYQQSGINSFFMPLLETAIKEYNWGYFDNWPDEVDLRTFWLFMLWRLQIHGSVDKLCEEVTMAFPTLLEQFSSEDYFSPKDKLKIFIKSRFVNRFLQFWGFVIVDPKCFVEGVKVEQKVEVQPLLKQSFVFS